MDAHYQEKQSTWEDGCAAWFLEIRGFVHLMSNWEVFHEKPFENESTITKKKKRTNHKTECQNSKVKTAWSKSHLQNVLVGGRKSISIVHFSTAVLYLSIWRFLKRYYNWVLMICLDSFFSSSNCKAVNVSGLGESDFSSCCHLNNHIVSYGNCLLYRFFHNVLT